MSLVSIVAAGGTSTRTGLGEYTTKAALTLRGKSLLAHQIDFLRRSGAARAIVVCRPEHARLLMSRLPPEDRAMTSFVAASDDLPGWAGRIEGALAHVDNSFVIAISCDNIHEHAATIDPSAASFTYTHWDRDTPPTTGPIFARDGNAWRERDSAGFQGDFFTGYVIADHRILKEALHHIQPSTRGEKEITSLLAVLVERLNAAAVPYPGKYIDIRDLPGLARAHAGLDPSDETVHVDVGAAILLSSGDRVLLTERADGRGWVPPGGIVDGGEKFAHAAMRETYEEVGVAVPEKRLRLLGVYPTQGKTGPAVSVVFHADVDPTPPIVYDPKEVRAAKWLTREEAAAVEIPFDLRGAVDDHFAGRELDCR